MALYSSQFGDLYGVGTARESYERTFSWGRKEQGLVTGVSISGAARDSGNSENSAILRPGLVMGIITGSGLWTNYSPTATDGSQVAQGIIPVSLRMTDLISGSNSQKVVGMIVGGPVQAALLVGLDQAARADMFGRFIFDDDFHGNRFPYNYITAKTADYQVVAADNGSVFTNQGAAGSVNFTLPTTIAAGFGARFLVEANQTVTVTAPSGKLVAYNNAAATSVAFSTGSQKVGGSVFVYANADATKYIAEYNLASASQTITVA